MSATQHGNLHRLPAMTIAGRVADAILTYASARAVTVDPEGRVWVEAVGDAAEVDLVGVYQRDVGVLALTRQIAADLQHERAQRREPRTGRRRYTRAA